jgi:hypothetical protein
MSAHGVGSFVAAGLQTAYTTIAVSAWARFQQTGKC